MIAMAGKKLIKMHLEFINFAKKYAKQHGIIVESLNKEYKCWREDDGSIVTLSKSPLELLNDIETLKEKSIQKDNHSNR